MRLRPTRWQAGARQKSQISFPSPLLVTTSGLVTGRVLSRVYFSVALGHHGVECISHLDGRWLQSREQFESVRSLIDRELAPGHDLGALCLGGIQERRPEWRVNRVGDPHALMQQ